MPLLGAVARDATAVDSRRTDLDDILSDYYQDHYIKYNQEWQALLYHDLTVDGAYVIAQGWHNPVLPRPIVRGEGRVVKGFGEITITHYVFDYGTPWQEWHEFDEADDKSPTKFAQRAREAADYLAKLKHFVLLEMLVGSASEFLHPHIKLNNPHGGTGNFSSTHSINGNTMDNDLDVTGSSIGNLHTDIYLGLAAYKDMPDTNGRSFWGSARTGETRFLIVAPEDLRKGLDGLFGGDMINSEGGTAPMSNYLKQKYGSNTQVEYFSELTSASTFYMFRVGTGSDNGAMRPFVHGTRMDPRWDVLDRSNSERANEQLVTSERGVSRQMLGVGWLHTSLRFS